ncbi:MarR family transcriptional regulator [Streptosporangium lutulentum]
MNVNGVELFLLGRTLMKIGEEAMPTEGIGDHSTGVRTVLIVVSDLREHPDSSVGEIAKRTGLPQSAVSAAVARLREAGSVVTMTDPGDRRAPGPAGPRSLRTGGAGPFDVYRGRPGRVARHRRSRADPRDRRRARIARAVPEPHEVHPAARMRSDPPAGDGTS